MQKLQRIPQQREWVARRAVLKSPPLPYVLIAVAMLVYVVIVWQWF